MENNDPRDEYLNWKNKENGVGIKIARQIKPIWILSFGLIFIFGNYFVSSGKISSSLFFGVLIVFGILIIFILFRGSPEPKLIPEQVIKQIAYEALERKRKEGMEIPFHAKIKVALPSESKYETDVYTGTSGLVSREVAAGVIINGCLKNYIIRVDPYKGTVLGIIPKPLGIRNESAFAKDVKIVPVQFIEGNK